MSDVTIEVAGRHYKMACGEGEEAHIAMLGHSIDAKLADMPNLHAQSEPRTLLFAALLLADELHESKQAANAQAVGNSEEDGKVAEMLEAFAERMETLASRLESNAASA